MDILVCSPYYPSKIHVQEPMEKKHRIDDNDVATLGRNIWEMGQGHTFWHELGEDLEI